MLNNEDDIERLFSERLKDAEAMPSDDIWSKLESNLEKHNVEGVYQTAFQNAVVEPSPSVWKKIANILAWKSFLTFKFNTFNIYYASVITAIVGLSAFQFFNRGDNSEQSVKQNISNKNNVSADNTESSQNKKISSDEFVSESQFESDENTFESRENDVDGKSSFNEATTITSSEKGNPKDKKNKNVSDSDNRNVDWSHVRIEGNKSVCENIPTTYSVEGLNVHADVQWSLPKAAKKNSSVGHNISIIWQEAGKQTITASVKVGDQRKTIDFPVTVEGVAVPVIKGKAKVCQGMEKQLYYVDESINKQISYLWESQQNPIDQIGNKYINVDWVKSGKDTLSVTKVNNTTGCKSQASLPIVIYPQPKIDFEFSPLGESEYEFAFSETQRKGYVYEWNIEGMEYNDPVVTHTASGSGSSFVVLTVTDKNKCSSTIQKEIDFNKNFIAVPSKFVPGSGKYFIPLTNADLVSYKFEIYNARNEKIWESTELSNGKPAAGWDGKFRGASLPRGKYLWKISATFDDGTKWKGVTQPNGSCKPSGIFVLEN